MSNCSYTAFSAPQPIRGQINWANGHRPTPLSYARFVNGEERRAESIELDGAVYAPVREYENVDKLKSERFTCSECGCRVYYEGYDGEPYMFVGECTEVPRFCPRCGAKVRGGGE